MKWYIHAIQMSIHAQAASPGKTIQTMRRWPSEPGCLALAATFVVTIENGHSKSTCAHELGLWANAKVKSWRWYRVDGVPDRMTVSSQKTHRDNWRKQPKARRVPQVHSTQQCVRKPEGEQMDRISQV